MSDEKKPGFFKRMALRRKAKQKKAANGSYIKTRKNSRAKGVIRVDAPVGTMPKPQQ